MSAPSNTRTVIFEDYFSLGQIESTSPFITRKTRMWGQNLFLKVSLFSLFLLALSFSLSFIPSLQPISYILLTGVYFFTGIPALIESIEDLLSIEINIDVLMTLAAFSSVFIGSGFEGGLLLVLFALSGAMEDAVTNKAKNTLKSLHKLSPTTAHVLLDNGGLRSRSTKTINVGTKIMVRAGEIVPLDGEVVNGISSVNLSHITGENKPVTKNIGDIVPAGAQNLDGAFTLKVTHTNSDSTIAKIIDMVTKATEAKPKLQRIFDTFSQTYALLIISLAFIFTVTLPNFLHIPVLGTEGSLYRSLAFLIAASPCALIIALPIAYLSAISICAKNGILLKGGLILDALTNCRTIAFDKTGTVTTGTLTCTNVKPLFSQGDNHTAIALASAMEKHAIHPIAKAIVSFADSKNILPANIDNFKSIPGRGLEALFESNPVYIGHPKFIAEKLSENQAEKLLSKTKELSKDGELLTVLLFQSETFLFQFQETVRPKIKETLHNLINKGLNLILLTGDREENAQAMSEKLGVTNYRSHLKPEDKLDIVSKLSQKDGLAMVGDGINDAPALARASVGICMGKVGQTAAMEAADIILLQDNIEHLNWLFNKAHMTKKIVKQNLSLALLAIAIATIPSLMGLVPLWLAVILHEGGTVLVGLNALRLLKK